MGVAFVLTSYPQLKPEYRTMVRMNIYPVPSGGGIPVGVHVTPTVSIPSSGHSYVHMLHLLISFFTRSTPDAVMRLLSVQELASLSPERVIDFSISN